MALPWNLDVHQALIAIILCLLFVRFLFKSQQTPKGYPPGADGLPFLGAILSIGSHMERTLAKWKAVYGPVSFVKLMSTRVVVLNTLDAIQLGFTKFDITGRWQPDILKETWFGCQLGITFIDYNERWREQRKFLVSTLSQFGLGKRKFEERILTEAEELCDKIQNAVPNMKGIDPGKSLALTTINIINKLSYGKCI